MSDYLANLAAKALGRTESVRPRVASRFEPVGTLPPLPAEPAGLESVSVQQPSDPVSTIRASAPPAAIGTDRFPPVVTAIAPAAMPASSRLGERSGEVATGPHLVKPAEGDAGAEPKASPGRAGSATPVTQEDPTPTRRSPRPETPVGVELAGLKTEKAPVADTNSQPDRASAQVEARMRGIEGRLASLEASARGHPATQREAASLIPVVTRPLPQPVPAPVPRTAPPVGASPIERRDRPPQVSVTIGRVEVRAAFPPPVQAPRTPTGRGAPTTLAEYLKHRERGRR